MIRGLDDDLPGEAGPDRRAVPSAPRARCPTCGARRTGALACHRCGSGLELLASIEARADRALESAREAYRKGCFRLAALCAAEARRLEARPALRLLAVSALRAGDFLQAARAGRMALGVPGGVGCR